ncbi:MAG: hypothetical protein PUQ00_32885 [Nostoc sp. S13]|nr:hypothetical protein [Nostoc sp. S13]
MLGVRDEQIHNLYEQYQYQRLIGEWLSFSDADVEQLSLGMKLIVRVMGFD